MRLENRKVIQRKLTKLLKCQKDANIEKGQKLPGRFYSSMVTPRHLIIKHLKIILSGMRFLSRNLTVQKRMTRHFLSTEGEKI